MSQRTLVLLRHAKSDWDGHEPDIDRPLARRGQREAPEAGQWLAGYLPPIDLAVVSPARRADETWQLVAAQLRKTTVVQVEDRVYAASGATLLSVVRDLPAGVGTALLVGHNPGLEELVTALTGELVPMPTSSIAVLLVDGGWSELTSAVLGAAGRPPVSRL